MVKKKLDNVIDFLKYEPYKSIINLLEIAPSYHPSFNAGLKPEQLMHILVKDFSVRVSTHRLLEGLRNFLTENIEVKGRVILDQEIAGEYPHQGFNKYLTKLKENSWIKKGKKERILLSEKHRMELLRFWCKDFIMKCPSTKISSFPNSMSIHPNVSLKKEEESEMELLMKELTRRANNFFGVVGLKRAGSTWSDFIDIFKAEPSMKFYFWLKIIFIHYLASNRPFFIISGDSNYMKNDIRPINYTTYMTLKINNFEGFPTHFYPYRELKNWQNKFKDLIHSIVEQKYSSFPRPEKIKLYEGDFIKLCDKTLLTRINSQFYTVILRPELSYFYLKDIEDIGEDMAQRISRSAEIGSEKDGSSYSGPKSLDTPERYWILNQILDGRSNKIKELRYKNQTDLINELSYLIDAFEIPISY